MINLDLDIGLLSRYYNIGASALEEYKNKSLTEIMEIEATKGNTKAANFLMEITSSPAKLAQLFQLVDPKNRYLILSHMNEKDLMEIMQYLEPKELVLGLSVFTPEVLVELMKNLDQEILANLVLTTFSPDKFVDLLPEKFLDEFISSDKISKNLFMKALEKIDESELQKMMEKYSGQSCYDDKSTIIGNLGQMDNENFQKAMFSISEKGKKQLVQGLLSEKPELMEEFSTEAMTHPFKSMGKEEVLKALANLDTEDMLPMIEKVPQEIMALIATQIDPQMFSEILCRDFKDIISQCGI